MIPAVAYLRCSSIGAIEGDTWNRQRAAIAKYVHDAGIEIVEEFRDEGVSGRTEMQDRQGLAACMARVEANGIKIVMVESADRLARDLLVNELILKEFRKAGVKVITASGIELCGETDNNPTAKLVRQILAAIAEFDRSVIVLKLRAARERQRAKGERCEGRKPYGSLALEQGTMNTMVACRNQGWSSPQIAHYLNNLKLYSRYGKPWSAGTISKILNRQTSDDTKTT